MKKHIAFLLVCLCAWSLRAQIPYMNLCASQVQEQLVFDFNSPNDSTTHYFERDTTQANNIWQLGKVNKTVFDTSYHGAKAWVTDTVNPYPINNTSSFEIAMLSCSYQTQYGGGYWGTDLGVIFKINSDSAKDGGMIEFSLNGSPWANLITSPPSFLHPILGDVYTINDTVESLHQPGYSGVDNSWKFVYFWFSPLATQVGYDSLKFRFTFSSDSIQTNKDGWLIGRLETNGLYESIEEFQNNALIRLAPNPAADEIQITSLIPEAADRIQIFNTTGQVVFDQSKFSASSIDVRAFPNGIYILKYNKDNLFATKRFVVQH